MEIVQSSDSGNGLAISGCGFVFFVVRSDRNSGSSDVRRRTLEVLHTAVELLPQRCVRRPSSWSQVLVTLTVQQEVFHYHGLRITVACKGFSNAEVCVHVVPKS